MNKGTAKIKSYIIITLLILAVGVYLVFKSVFKSCSDLDCISFQDADKYRLKETYQDDANIFRGLFTKSDNDTELIRLDVRALNPKEAETLRNSQIIRIKGLFEKAASPYPGEISEEIICADKFMPQFSEKNINDITFSYFTSFVNDRLVFGACTEDQAVYDNTYIIFYCRNQSKYYQLEFITTASEDLTHKNQNQLIESIECI